MNENGHDFDGIEWQLITNYLSGECSDAERHRVEGWMEGDPLRRGRIEALQRVLETRAKRDLQSQTAAAWDDVLRRTRSIPREGQPPARLRLYPVFLRATKIAAVILLIVGLPYAIVKLRTLKTETKAQPAMCIVYTERGQHTNIRLSDGTAVTLNSQSAMEFPEEFRNGPREVVLSGEAYFAVAQKEGVPFRVRTGRAVVDVVGTEFNVSAWPEERSVDVVVVKGKVSVQSALTGVPGTVVLTQGQRTSVFEGKAPSMPQIVSMEKYTAWVQGRLMFENTPFRDVIKTLERQYDFKCTVKDSSLLTYHITASFKNESLSDILRLMAISMGARYERNGSLVTFFASVRTKE